ncbi:unnamed protein product [Mycena citricolor]|uniref:RecQ-mediated genome instability protein 1 n=1 Tax=Mycena citricolor TaxID=2018698 RepID=A0AAD2H2U0_9AGAR|nr:unnamed protein product [Mycena citricolor]
MSAIPPRLISWLREHYPSPQVDPEWLDACYNWVITEHELDPATHMASIIQNVEAQLLQSDLCDSMCHGTGIPLSLLTAVSGTLRGPVLVEIVAITEVGASALALDQVRVVRDERLAAGEIEGDDEVDLEVDGEGAVPNYPRSMLRFELSDGASKVSAFEYRPLPELNLGVTPLGYKGKLILKNVLMRRGMAFLEPSCVEFKGQKTEDREVQQSTDFARELRHRLGNLEPQPEVSQAPAPQEMRSPLREISQPPSPPAAGLHNHSDDEEQPRRRRVPGPPPSVSSSSTIVTSPYFPSSGSAAGAVPAASPRMGLALSPTRSAPIEIDISDDEDSQIYL